MDLSSNTGEISMINGENEEYQNDRIIKYKICYRFRYFLAIVLDIFGYRFRYFLAIVLGIFWLSF
jgi:DNA-binding XRE family transcriptional regulator